MKWIAAAIIFFAGAYSAVGQETQTAPPSAFDVIADDSTANGVLFVAAIEGGILPYNLTEIGLSGVSTCCPMFYSASGGSIGLRGGVSIPLLDWLSAEATIGLSWLQPFTNAYESQYFNDNFETVRGTIYHSITVNMYTVDLRVSSVISVTDNLSFLFSPSYVLPISTNYTQVERLERPTTIEFVNGSRDWNGSDGPLETASAFVSLGFGARYAFNLSSGLVLAPEVSYHYSLSDFTPGWRVHRALVGVTVQWR